MQLLRRTQDVSTFLNPHGLQFYRSSHEEIATVLTDGEFTGFFSEGTREKIASILTNNEFKDFDGVLININGSYMMAIIVTGSMIGYVQEIRLYDTVDSPRRDPRNFSCIIL